MIDVNGFKLRIDLVMPGLPPNQACDKCGETHDPKKDCDTPLFPYDARESLETMENKAKEGTLGKD